MYLYSPPDFHSFESIMSLTERRGRNVNSQWKKISEVNRQTHGNSCIFLFLFLHIITFPEKQLYLSDCGFECYANCTLNLPQDCSELFCFFYFFLPHTHICKYKVAFRLLRDIQILMCYCRQYANKTPYIKWCILIFVSIIIPNVIIFLAKMFSINITYINYLFIFNVAIYIANSTSRK